MRIHNFIIALIILTGCQHSLVNDRIPTITRTGEVKDVFIQDTVSPSSVLARPGDEIRWINKRQTDVQVIVTSPVQDQLLCQRNFKQTMEADRNKYTANVERNDTAGVCFREPTELRYVVRTDSSDPSGEPTFLGTVTIAPDEQRWPSMQLPERASLAEEEPS